MISEEELASLVPDRYAPFRRIVAEGVLFYLDHLSPARLDRMMRIQSDLPADADLSTRLVHILHQSPALHKLGQVIARRRELDPALRLRLQQLESMEPRTPMDQIRPIIETELKDPIALEQLRIADEPLAEASVAVVVPFKYRTATGLAEGVLKVLKPDVTEHLNEDLDILAQLADHIDQRRSEYSLSDVEFRDTFDDTREILTHEVHFEWEQANLAEAHRLYAGRTGVHVPAPLPRFSSRSITAMQRLHGTKVTELTSDGLMRRGSLARAVVDSLVAGPILSREDDALFHADPHAGNLLATDDGGLGILDWSLTGRLTRPQRQQMLQILVGAVCMDRRAVARALQELASAPAEDQISGVLDASLASLRWGRLPGLDWLLHLLDSCAHAGVRFPADLLLFRKAFFTLEGVVADLRPSCSLEQMLLPTALFQLASEWPMRFFRTLESRDYATHLSTADLMRVAFNFPFRLLQPS